MNTTKAKEIELTLEQLQEKYKDIYTDATLAQYVTQFFDLSAKGDVDGAVALTQEVFKHHEEALVLTEPFIEAEYIKRKADQGEPIVKTEEV